MKKIQIILLLCVFLGTTTFAQITLTLNNMPKAGMTTFGAYDDSTNLETARLGNAGVNQTWDFSNTLPTSASLVTAAYMNVGDTPYAADFPTANLAENINLGGVDYGFFYTLSDQNAYANLGYKVGNGYFEKYDRPDKVFVFPFSYLSTFDQSYSSAGYLDARTTIASTFRQHVEADAWGTVKTNLGMFPCLRVKRIQFDTSRISNYGTSTQKDTIFEWWTAQHRDPVFTYALSTVKQPNGSIQIFKSTTMLTRQLTAVNEPKAENNIHSAFPNPTNGLTTLLFDMKTAAIVDFLTYSLDGKLVAAERGVFCPEGRNTQSLNLSSMQSGIYTTVLVSNSKQIGLQKIVVD